MLFALLRWAEQPGNVQLGPVSIDRSRLGFTVGTVAVLEAVFWTLQLFYAIVGRSERLAAHKIECGPHVAVGETVILITPPFLSLLKHLLKVVEGAAE